ncbi:hypothetical protein CSIRO_0388 [Bradyrhizobiaceae bacterium SG-6C]|nr:hypothetical protein CSIRO_0388 [Bradyrhizobiaceae bacterium SG-6C]
MMGLSWPDLHVAGARKGASNRVTSSSVDGSSMMIIAS